MTATSILTAEHRGIEAMLTVLDRACDACEAGRPVPADLLRKCVDFFRNFADRCHHHKEEDFLFPRLAERGVPLSAGPIGSMLHEHREGRALLDRLARAVDQEDRTGIVQAGRSYSRLLRQHIAKEDGVLFPLADRLLAAEEQEALAREFDALERAEIGEGVHEQYHSMIGELQAASAAL